MKRPEILVAIGSVIAVAASATLPMAASAATNITGTVTLTDDADWTAHGKVTIASGATLDLDGHTLKVAGLDGEGTIASGEGFSNLTTDPSKATCSAGIDSVDSGATADRAFDDTNRVIVKNENSYWPFSVVYDFGTQTLVNQYRITATDKHAYFSRAPGSWAMWGSNDNETWTIIGGTNTCSQDSWATTGKGGTKNFALDNDVEYRYCKIEIHQSSNPAASQGGFIEFKQLQFGRASVGNIIVEDGVADASSLTVSDSVSLTLSGSSVLSQDCDLRPFGTSLSVAEGATIDLSGHKLYVAASAQIGACTVRDADPVDLTSPDTTGNHVTQTGTFSGGTVGANLFNNNYSREIDGTHRILVATNALPVSVAYDFGEPTIVDAYRIWTGPIKNQTSRLPMRWKIEGSNDGVDWTLLDYRKGVSGYGDTNGHRTYSFDNTTAYSRYRITLEAPQVDNNGYLEMVQLEYYRLKPTQGELHIDTTGVSDAVEYSGLSLTGNMRLVKEGAGTICLSKKYQGNVGGLVVLGGIVIPGADTATTIAAAYLGEMGSDIIVRGNNTGDAGAEDGVVKFNTIEGYTGYRYILDGGSLYDPGLANITDMRLDSDSWLKLTATTPKNGTNYVGRADTPSFIDLRGHTLSATIDTSGGGGKTLYLYNVTVDNGLVDVKSGGWFGSRGTIVATNACVITHCAMDVQGEFLLRDYRHLQENSGFNRGAGIIDVYGTFSMVRRLFHGARLHDGSTIDLATDYVTAQPLPTVAMFADSQTGDKTLRFEPGATIGVKLGERKVEKGTRIISWDAETAPDATVKFKSADADRRYSLVVKDDGLYYVGSGFIISIY